MDRAPRVRPVAALLLLLPASLLGAQPFAERAVWHYGAYAPAPRFEGAGALVRGELYVIAGFFDAGLHITPRVDSYDPARDRWTGRAPIPIPVTHAGVAVDGDSVWIAGGFLGDHPGPPTTAVQRYDAAADAWRPGPSLPTARASGAMVRLGRSLHYIGGLRSRDDDATAEDGSHLVLELDRDGASWQTAAPLPLPRNHLGAAVVDGKIFAIGGQFGHDTDTIDVDLVHVFDPATSGWRQVASLPQARSHFESGTIVVDGELVVVGGRDNGTGRESLAEVTRYDPKSDLWVELPSLPEPLLGPIASIVGNRLVVTGGGLKYDLPRASTRYRAWRDAPAGDEAGAEAAACGSLSTLDCAALPARLPLQLDWGGDQGGLSDAAGVGTGFTLAFPPATRLDGDAPVFDALVSGYEPARLSVRRGRLAVRPTAGSFFKSSLAGGNSQLDALAVAIDAQDALVIETLLAPPAAAELVAEAGLWFGLGERSYVKLVVRTGQGARGVELGYELRDVYAGPGAALEPPSQGSACSGPSAGGDVELQLRLDPETRVVTGLCRSPGSAWSEVGAMGVDPSLFAGVRLPSGPRHPVSFAGILASASVRDAPAVRFDAFSITPDATRRSTRPRLLGVDPSDGAVDVAIDSGVVSERVRLPNGGIDARTLGEASVRLLGPEGTPVPAHVNTSGSFDVIALQPSQPLAPRTSYVFEVTDRLRDESGASFQPFRSSFTTGDPEPAAAGRIAFEKRPFGGADGEFVTSLALGPDARLYCTTLDGRILRFALEHDGSAGAREVIDSVARAEGEPRFMIGLAFDPAATPDQPTLWVTHTSSGGTDWSGKLSRVSGSRLETVQDYVVGLPRSALDHVTNGIAFGPDGALYISQGGNTGAGAPDPTWTGRPEHLLSAAILRLDVAAVASPPLDVRTEGGAGYDPYAPGAPLTLYATGVRNAYDLVWHSDGRLYVPNNGANDGNTPASVPGALRPDGTRHQGRPVPALSGVAAQPDSLFRVEAGGYYGHPNAARGEFVLNGGNPTPGLGNDPSEVAEYPDGTPSDPRWRRVAFDFGLHKSPNGIVEYRGDAFGGALAGRLLVVRYSQGDDIVALTPARDGAGPVTAQTGIPGFTGFSDPLDLAVNPANGDIYVAEVHRFVEQLRRITLLRPRPPLAADPGATRPESRD